MLESDHKKLLVESYMVNILGLELTNKYMKLLDEVVESKGLTFDEMFKYYSDKDIIEALEHDVNKYVVVVRDTRLARKMYPDYNIRPDGQLVVEILDPTKGQ